MTELLYQFPFIFSTPTPTPAPVQTNIATPIIISFLVILGVGFGFIAVANALKVQPKECLIIQLSVLALLIAYDIYLTISVGLLIDAILDWTATIIIIVVYAFVNRDLFSNKIPGTRNYFLKKIEELEGEKNYLEKNNEMLSVEFDILKKALENITKKNFAFDEQIAFGTFHLLQDHLPIVETATRDTLELIISFLKEKIIEKSGGEEIRMSLLIPTPDNKFRVLICKGLTTEIRDGIQADFSFSEDPARSIAGYAAKYVKTVFIEDLAKMPDFYKNYWVELSERSEQYGFLYCRAIKKGVGRLRKKECAAVFNISSPQPNCICEKDIDGIINVFMPRLEAMVYLFQFCENFTLIQRQK